jgi:hypothetical protein
MSERELKSIIKGLVKEVEWQLVRHKYDPVGQVFPNDRYLMLLKGKIIAYEHILRSLYSLNA